MPTAEVIAHLTVPDGPMSVEGTFRTGWQTGLYVLDDYVAAGYVEDLGSSAPPSEATATLEVDSTVGAALHPSPGQLQYIGVEIWVNGALVPFNQMVGPWSVERSLDRNLQTFMFTVRVDDGLSWFGTPFDTHGAPTGKTEVDIYGVYLAGSGLVRFPLILRGVAHLASRTDAEEGSFEEFVGVGPGGRLRKPVSVVLPIGSGFTRDRIVREILERGGETRFALEEGNPVLKEVHFIDSDPVAAAQELMDVEGRMVVWNVNGEVTNPRVGLPSPDEPLADTFDEYDYLTDPVLTAPEEAVTKVTFAGSQKVIEETDPNGLLTLEFISTVEAIPGQMWMGGSQASNCVITPISQPDPVETPRRVRRVRTRITSKCSVVIRQFSETWEYIAIEANRYDWGGSVWDCRGSVYVEAGTVANDNGAAFIDNYIRWRKVGEIDRRIYYDAPGFRAISAPPVPRGFKLLGSEGDGTLHLLGTVTEVKQYYNPRTALKDGPPTASWEEEPFRSSVRRLGSFEGVTLSQAALKVTEQITEIVDSTEDGYIQKQSIYRERWHARPGDDYWYGGGFESRDQDEVFDVAETRIIEYQVLDDFFHIVTDTRLGVDDRLIESTTSPASGQPPAVDVIPTLTEEEIETFPELADRECQVVRSSSQPITVTVEAPDLLNAHLENHVKTSLPWAESVEELQAAAEMVIEESLVLIYEFQIPAHYALTEGQKIRVRNAKLGVDHDARVWAIRYGANDPLGGVVCDVSAKIYPEDILV